MADLERTNKNLVDNHKNEIYNLEKLHLFDREKRRLEFEDKLEHMVDDLCKTKHSKNIEIMKELIDENSSLRSRLKSLMLLSDKIIQKNDKLKRKVMFIVVNLRLNQANESFGFN